MSKSKGKGMHLSSPVVGKTIGKVMADGKKPMEHRSQIMKTPKGVKGGKGRGR